MKELMNAFTPQQWFVLIIFGVLWFVVVAFISGVSDMEVEKRSKEYTDWKSR